MLAQASVGLVWVLVALMAVLVLVFLCSGGGGSSSSSSGDIDRLSDFDTMPITCQKKQIEVVVNMLKPQLGKQQHALLLQRGLRVKLTHETQPKTWKCRELNLPFYQPAGRQKKKERKEERYFTND